MKSNPLKTLTVLVALSLCSAGAFSQGIGINAATPNTRLDVNGDFALRMSSFAAATNNNNMAIGASSFIRITGPTAVFNINGIAGGVDGKTVILYNATGFDMMINHQSGSSTAANRIICSDYANVVVKRGGCATLMYSTADARWIMVSSFKQ